MSNSAASIRARLLNVAKAQGVDFNQVLVRFALERILYRLTQSPHADRFLLKGALLFTLWYDMPHRATRDADLLGFGASDLESVAQVFRDIAAIAVDDGIVFDPVSVSVEEIRKEAGYGGVRVVIAGELAKARCKTQIDVGFGDAVTPGPVDSIYPVLLGDMPAPRLRAYPTYTVVAEKLHAIALLGMTNSRVKDYFDLSILLKRETFDADLLAQAIKATFERYRRAGRAAGWPHGRIRARFLTAGTVAGIRQEERTRSRAVGHCRGPTADGLGTSVEASHSIATRLSTTSGLRRALRPARHPFQRATSPSISSSRFTAQLRLASMEQASSSGRTSSRAARMSASSKLRKAVTVESMCITSSRLAITHFITHIGSSLLWKSVEPLRHQLLLNQQLTYPQ